MKDKYTYKQDNKSKLMQNIEKLCSSAQNHPNDYTLITVDGVKLLYEKEQKWVHVRFSNTEPIIRIIAEAKTV